MQKWHGICIIISIGKSNQWRYNMINYIYGIATSATIITMVDVIDRNVPNNIWYWLDLYSPF